MPESAGEKTKRLILDAALKVIDREGVDAVTHRRVGEIAGLSHGVVGYHFQKRDELILKAFEYHLGAIDDYGTRIGLRDKETYDREQIIAVLCNLVAEELTNRSSIRIDLELTLHATRHPALAKMFNAWMDSGIDRLASALKRSSFAQSNRLARALTNLVRGFLIECLLDGTLSNRQFRDRANTLFAERVQTR